MNRVKFKYEQELFQLEVKLCENRKSGLLKYECSSMYTWLVALELIDSNISKDILLFEILIDRNGLCILMSHCCVRCAHVVTLTLLYSSDYRIYVEKRYEERGLGHF